MSIDRWRLDFGSVMISAENSSGLQDYGQLPPASLFLSSPTELRVRLARRRARLGQRRLA